MYKIETDELLSVFGRVNKMFKGNLLEISIKKSRINFEFVDGNLLHVYAIQGLMKDSMIVEDYLYLTSLNDNIRLTFDCEDKVIHNDIPEDSVFYKCFELLDELGEHICQCPALEYTISSEFVKVFIDKPNIMSTDLSQLSEVFYDEPFSLELQKQRPYCLFVATTKKPEKISEYVEPPLVNSTVLSSDMVRKI